MNNDIIQEFFDDELHNFNRIMIAKQESLAEEFERILYDNLWELYE